MTDTEQVDLYIKGEEGWKSEILTQLRAIIHQADSGITEGWKWGVPVFSKKKMVCATSSFKDHVKINFFNGALLSDPKKLFNNGFDSKKHRSIDFKEGDTLDTVGIIGLVKEAVEI